MSDEDYKLYGSKETLDGMGSAAARFPGWSRSNVVAISAGDLPPMKDLIWMDRKKQDDLFIEAIKKQAPDIDISPQQEKTIRVDPASLALVTSKRDTAAIFPFPANSGALDGLMIAFPQGTQKEQIAAKISGLPQDKLKNLPGDSDDWLALAYSHEAAHFRSNADEMGADRQAFKTYFNERARGADYDPNVPLAFREARSLSVIKGNGGEIHNTASGLTIPKEPKAPANTIDEATLHGMVFDFKVHKKIADDIGASPTETEKLAKDDPQLYMETVRQMNHAGAFDHDPIQKRQAELIIQGEKYVDNSPKIPPINFSPQRSDMPAPSTSFPAPR